MSLHDSTNNVAGGDPERIRAEATRLLRVCDEIAQVVQRLRAVSTRGVWDSGAGHAFAARVGEVPSQLDSVRERLEVAGGLLPPYADLLEVAQRRLRDLDDDYLRAKRTMDERDRQLDQIPPEAPERARLLAERGEASVESYTAQEEFIRVSDEIVADEKRMAARLSDTSPELDDPQGYDVFEGLRALGTSSLVTGPASMIIRPVAIAAIADPIGQLGLLTVYDQGTSADVATAAKTALLGMVKLPMGKGARADAAVRQASRTREVAAARARYSAGPTPTPVTRTRQTTAQARVRAKHSAQDAFDDVTGIRLITNMTSDWAAIAGAGPVTKGVHILKYTMASAQKVDATVGTAQTTADTIRSKTKKKSVAPPSAQCKR